jgi:predicted amidohydrolase
MSRIVTVGAAQLGPDPAGSTRARAWSRRMIDLMRAGRLARLQAGRLPRTGADHLLPALVHGGRRPRSTLLRARDALQRDAPLFDEARASASASRSAMPKLTIEDGREHVQHRRSSSIPSGRIISRYRKIHLPGHAEHEPWRAFQHLEKRYFEVGDLSWPVWPAVGGNMGMMICNDRRWPESYRVMGLQGVEMILLGYNTPRHNPPAPDHDRLSEFHNQLVMQAGAYQNATFVVGVAKGRRRGGLRDDRQLLHHRADRRGDRPGADSGDELIVARCDLDLTKSYKATTFNFDMHRQPDQYRRIVEQRGAVGPQG